MTLTPGTRLGPYEIAAPLGAGGMGEVYRARDTRLDRVVALKVLPQTVADDPDHRARFEREARAVASLSHPHICTLHDVGYENGVSFIVMECLEGESLAQRLEKGPLPTDLVLRHGIEIGNALARAHKQGIVHRDLKPGNVMITKAGAKLLDFGLARIMASSGAGAGLAEAATGTRPLTAEGTIMGTFQYMAPEQLEGREADHRSDIWALGCVLYEMAAGRRAFEGRSQASLIGAILKDDPPPISSAQPLAPPGLDHVVRTCLAKDPDDRWQSAHDVAGELNWIAQSGSSAALMPASRGRKPPAWLMATGLALWSLAAIFGGQKLAGTKETRVIRATIELPPGALLDGESFALSPDGSRLAFLTSTEGRTQLWVRALDALEPRPLAGTEGAAFPFWSPDGRAIAFFAAGKLKRIASEGGPVITVADAPYPRGGTWGQGGRIVFAPGSTGGLQEVSAGGGTPRTLTKTGQEGITHRLPWFLPDGKHVLFVVGIAAREDGIYVVSLDDGVPRRLLTDASQPRYANGYLFFQRDGNLVAQPFDARRLSLREAPVPVAERVSYDPDRWSNAASVRPGSLAYRAALAGGANGLAQLTWFDRDGREQGRVGAPGNHTLPLLSPDGSQALVRGDDHAANGQSLWILDLARAVFARFTPDSRRVDGFVWSPDGKQVAFARDRGQGFELVIKPAKSTEAERVLLKDGIWRSPLAWTSDGRLIAYATRGTGATTDIWMLPLTGGEAYPFLATEADETLAAFSPDGRWLAFASTESGRGEVFVTPFPGPGRKWQISLAGGDSPSWSSDGRELL